MVGGMPAVVAADSGGSHAVAIRDLQRDLIASYRADFAKYSRRIDHSILDATLMTARFFTIGNGKEDVRAKSITSCRLTAV